MGELYFLGWDVGSWKCSGKSHDALCLLKSNGGAPTSAAAFKGNLLERKRGLPSLSTLFSALNYELPSNARLVIAIDAVFGWPGEFAKLLAGNPTFDPDCAAPHTTNRFLYRETERFLAKTFKFGSNPPMSAVDGAIGGAATKAQYFLHHLRASLPCYMPPFDAWDMKSFASASISVIEVYPSATKLSPAFLDVSVPGGGRGDAIGSGDAADALRAALVAACYAETVGRLRIGLPYVYLPDSPAAAGLDHGLIRKEGWIFTPM